MAVITKLGELPEILRIILEFVEDSDLTACQKTCILWNSIIQNIQNEYRRKLKYRELWGPYCHIKLGLLGSEVFTPIYQDRIGYVSPKQAYLDWRRHWNLYEKKKAQGENV
jgi:hypothetical protein